MEGTDKPRWWSVHSQSPQLRPFEYINILENAYMSLVDFLDHLQAYPSAFAYIVRSTPCTVEAGVTLCLYL